MLHVNEASEKCKSVTVADALRDLMGDAVPEDVQVGLKKNEVLLSTFEHVVDDVLQGIFDKRSDTYTQEPEAMSDYLQHSAYLVHVPSTDCDAEGAQADATPVLQFCRLLCKVLDTEHPQAVGEPKLQLAFVRAYVNAYSVLCIALYTAALLTLCKGLQGAEEHEEEIEELIRDSLQRVAVETHVYRVLCGVDDASQCLLRDVVLGDAFDRCVPSTQLHSAVRRVVVLLLQRDHFAEMALSCSTFDSVTSPSRIITGVLWSRLKFGGEVTAFGVLHGLTDPLDVYKKYYESMKTKHGAEGDAQSAEVAKLHHSRQQHEEFNFFVAMHCYLSCESISGADTQSGFEKLGWMLSERSKLVQKRFLGFVMGAAASFVGSFWDAEEESTSTQTEPGFWATYGSLLGADVQMLYLLFTCRSLVLQMEMKRQEMDSSDQFGHSRLVQAVRSAVVSILPRMDKLLKGLPFWRPKDWDFISQVTTWMLDEEIEKVRRSSPASSAMHPTAQAQKWDDIFRMVAACPDPSCTEQLLSTLIDAVLSSGSVPIQRFLAHSWKRQLTSNIVVTLQNDPTYPNASTLSITLPATSQAGTAYHTARIAMKSISICVVTGSNVHGLRTFTPDVELLQGNAIRVTTAQNVHTYRVSLGTVLRECGATEERNVQLVVGYAGLLPQVLRCTASPASALQLLPQHAHQVNPAGMICRLLLAKGDEASIHNLLDGHGVPHAYELLVQFLTRRLEYTAAARVCYKIVEKVRGSPRAGIEHLEEALAALCLSRSLLVSSKAEGFSLLADDPSSGVPSSNRVGHDATESGFVTVEMLSNRRCTLEAEIALLKRSEGTSPLQLQQRSNSELLEMLVEKSLYTQAARFASTRNLSLASIFKAATAKCMETDLDTRIKKRTKDKLWNEVYALLGKYSTQETVWQYHVTVCGVVVAMGGIPSGTVLAPLRKHRPDAVVRVCAEHGSWASMELALDYTLQYFKGHAQHNATRFQEENGFAPSAVIPVSLLDSLITRCYTVLDKANADDTPQHFFRLQLDQLLQYWDGCPPPLKKIQVVAERPKAKPKVRAETTMPPPDAKLGVAGFKGGFGAAAGGLFGGKPAQWGS